MPAQSFIEHITSLQYVAMEQSSAAAIPGVVPTMWSTIDTYPIGVPLYSPAGFMTALDRTDLNNLCIAAYTTGATPNAGRVGHVAAIKMAIDHMACRERALHARHATPARLRAWRAARQSGHAQAAGTFGQFYNAVTDVYDAASQAPNEQT